MTNQLNHCEDPYSIKSVVNYVNDTLLYSGPITKVELIKQLQWVLDQYIVEDIND